MYIVQYPETFDKIFKCNISLFLGITFRVLLRAIAINNHTFNLL